MKFVLCDIAAGRRAVRLLSLARSVGSSPKDYAYDVLVFFHVHSLTDLMGVVRSLLHVGCMIGGYRSKATSFQQTRNFCPI